MQTKPVPETRNKNHNLSKQSSYIDINIKDNKKQNMNIKESLDSPTQGSIRKVKVYNTYTSQKQ